MYQHCVNNGPWYSTIICPKHCGVKFEELYSTERKNRYEVMFFLDTHVKDQDKCSGSTGSRGGFISQ